MDTQTKREIPAVWESVRKNKISTHKDTNEVKFAKLDGIGPSKEFPSNLLYNLTD